MKLVTSGTELLQELRKRAGDSGLVVVPGAAKGNDADMGISLRLRKEVFGNRRWTSARIAANEANRPQQ